MKPGSNINYGSLSTLIQELIDFEQELEENRHSLDFDLGLIMERGRGIRYMSTPPDVIPFARAGVDGLQYGFLTDFGIIADPAQAPVVCVSPMHWNGVWLVARNLQEFLSIVYTDNSPLIHYYEHTDAYLHDLARRQAPVYDERRQMVRELFRTRFGIQPIEDMVRYIKELRITRRRSIAVQTLNGLGVVPLSSEQHVHTPFSLPDTLLWERDGKRIRQFFLKASVESRLAFIRDAQTKHLFTDCSLRTFVTAQLRTMGMPDAADHLDESYYTVVMES
ncbi:hypothetical protein OIN60_00755 [Paenibacillus sp. P96]|uniref:Uncharacterized protein n=1 Tax=Paenibacillus zeirhizosphaerae TaxID=2987519 RepID=A0ABT9FLB6_9BACL|nr:hypothetical protein [Paenibacillus sp. P96]MDP4095321.1 hypothetical protein [Paenibacillus sp. P96]